MTPKAAERFIRANLALRPPPGLPAIRLHAAHAGSGLRRLAGAAAPFWAFAWPGGLALARFLLENRNLAEGKRVLDLGCGGGLVGIAAAQAGAAEVIAVDPDPLARLAARLNAEANGVSLSIAPVPPFPPDMDLVVAGDVFYAPAVARRMIEYFRPCRAAGIDVLVGDPGRAHLPRRLLTELAQYGVRDFADAAATGSVFAFERSPPDGAGPARGAAPSPPLGN